ncbi:ATP-binding cassette domain-containing protein [Mesorhizobium sp. M0998]|uniref:ATP-binding cassette domain-containing protein n=1 Tax=Mesorhizobium sp. M0998 TaxID=2957044 RepID=UPI00333595A3
MKIADVSKRFSVAGHQVQALSHIHLAVDDGEFVSIVGSSGCGKSTLLRLVLGLNTDCDGDIRVDGQRVERPGLDRSIVFQEHRLLPWLNVEANVAAALRQSRLGAGERGELVRDHLHLVGLDQFAKAYPAQLSGGPSAHVAAKTANRRSAKCAGMDLPENLGLVRQWFPRSHSAGSAAQSPR